NIIQLMIGRKIKKDYMEKVKKDLGKEIIKVEGITNNRSFKGVSFSIREGEILGLYGLIGAGRTEIAEAIFGIRKIDSGKVSFEGKEQQITTRDKAVQLGIRFVPENRKDQGLILGMSCKDNMTMVNLDKLNSLGFISPEKEKDIFNEYRE